LWNRRARRDTLLLVRSLTVVLGIALALANVRPGYAADDLASSDYRVRMSAALVLGRSSEASARKDLERLLSDSHPAVRAAAAASLAKVGDAESVKILKSRLESEREDSVRVQITRAVEAAEARKTKKLFVQVGTFRNTSKSGGANISKIGNSAARTNAVKYAQLVDTDESAASAAGKQSRVVRLEGELRSLSLSKQGGIVTVHAKVEFSVIQLPGKTLKGVISGAATSRDAGVSVATLQEMAVQGAVESALGNAGPSLLAALD
jgi:hypothetical protein